MESHIDNKRIAKNTLYMYLRMFIILGVTLYTARIVIRTLGLDDYGIYNIVGGIVILFSFISISLKNAFQRFLSFELGKNDTKGVYRVINSSIIIIIIISSVILILSETIGLWFLINKLKIPNDRYESALWVYQFSILTFILGLFQTVFQAIVVSYEKFSFFAVYSIVEIILKLIVAISIVLLDSDKLVYYGLFLSIVTFINLLVIICYSLRFLKIKFIGYKSVKTFKSIFSYSGWAMLNSSSVIVAQQGGNILLNLFNGVIANGAYGIANQVSAAVNGFVSNFQSTFNPQIIKSYAANEYKGMFKLINRSALYSFYLLLIITVPFFLGINEILTVWLGETPPYAAEFCNLMLLYFLVDSAQAPLWMLIYATGRVRTYQIWSGCISILNIPISAFLLYLGYSIYWIFIVRVSLNLICAVIRTFYVGYLVKEFSVNDYFRYCILPIMKTSLFVAAVLYLIKTLIGGDTALSMLIGVLIIAVFIWFVGMRREERKSLICLVKSKI